MEISVHILLFLHVMIYVIISKCVTVNGHCRPRPNVF